MDKFFKCIIKYPALITLIGLFVNVFCFKAHLGDGNWLNWIWFIFNCIVCLLSVFFVSGDIFDDEDESRTLFKLLNGLSSFIIYGSVILKYSIIGIVDSNLIYLATFAFILQNGIGQYSSLLSSIIALVYIYDKYIILDNYYSIILFVIALLSIVIAIISLWLTKLGDDDDYDITPIAVLGILSVLVCFLVKSNFPVLNENRLYLFGGFLICSCYSFITNKALLYATLPIAIVSYSIYFLFKFDTASIVIISCLLVFSFSSYIYITNLKYIVNHLQSQLYSIKKEYKSLADENQKLKIIVNELKESNSDIDGRSGGSSIVETFGRGINIARSVDWVLDKLSIFIEDL